MEFTQSGMEEVVAELALGSCHRHVDGFRILLEVFDIVGCVTSFNGRQILGAFILAFPEKILPKTLCEFGGKHVAPGRPW